jgi:hypothetical protein
MRVEWAVGQAETIVMSPYCLPDEKERVVAFTYPDIDLWKFTFEFFDLVVPRDLDRSCFRDGRYCIKCVKGETSVVAGCYWLGRGGTREGDVTITVERDVREGGGCAVKVDFVPAEEVSHGVKVASTTVFYL